MTKKKWDFKGDMMKQENMNNKIEKIVLYCPNNWSHAVGCT